MGADLKEVDTDKLKELLSMQRQWQQDQDAKAYATAIADFQSEMPPVFKGRSESKGKYSYAAYEDIMKVARPILKKHGLSVSFSQSETDSTLTVVCRVTHRSGHSEETPFTLPKDGPIKTREGANVTSMAQAQGSANSYAKRYCLCNALDIVVTGEDDDAASLVNLITDKQHDELCSLLDQTGGQETCQRILDWIEVEDTRKIPEARVGEVFTNLRKLLERKEAK